MLYIHHQLFVSAGVILAVQKFAKRNNYVATIVPSLPLNHCWPSSALFRGAKKDGGPKPMS